jgi:hypothetical protein
MNGQEQDFSLLHRVQTGSYPMGTWDDFPTVKISYQTASEAHPTPYLMVLWAIFSGIKLLGYEFGHPPPIRAEVNNGGAITPYPPTQEVSSL